MDGKILSFLFTEEFIVYTQLMTKLQYLQSPCMNSREKFPWAEDVVKLIEFMLSYPKPELKP